MCYGEGRGMGRGVAGYSFERFSTAGCYPSGFGWLLLILGNYVQASHTPDPSLGRGGRELRSF